MTKKLRWKRNPPETGLAAVGARPRGYVYHDGEEEYASICPLGGGWSSRQNGWFWVAFSGGGTPYMNTCNTPVETVEQAKKEASEYVKAHLK